MGQVSELLHVVNDANKQIGAASRQTVWEKGYIHRGVWGIARSPDNEILVQSRASHNPLHPSRYDVSWRGEVPAGQPYRRMARAHALEKLGLVGLDLKPRGLHYAETDDAFAPHMGSAVLRQFAAAYITDIFEAPSKLDRLETARVEWWPPERVVELAHDQPCQMTDALRAVAVNYLQEG